MPGLLGWNAKLARRSGPGTPVLGPLRLGATFGDVYTGTIASTAVTTQRRGFRMRHYFSGPNDHYELRFVICNWWASGGTNGEKSVGNSVTRAMSVELNGRAVMVKWSGASSVILADKQTYLVSDPLYPAVFGLTKFTANSMFYTRNRSDMPTTTALMPYGVGAGMGISGVSGYACDPQYDDQLGNTGAMVTTGNYTSSAYCSGPSAILTRTYLPNLAVNLTGDSIVYGNADNVSDGGPTPGTGGYAQASMYNYDGAGNIAGYARTAIVNETAYTYSQATPATLGVVGGGTYRKAMMQWASHATCDHGTNDIDFGTYSLAQIQTAITSNVTAWRSYSNVKHFEYINILPRTNTTNTGPHSAGFTPGDKRDQLNAWLAATPPAGIDTVISFNPYLEDQTTTNSGLWNTTTYAFPSDGTHPIHAAHQGIMLATFKARVASWVPSF